MLHMIIDQIDAYKTAVETRERAQINFLFDLDHPDDDCDVNACREEEQLRRDGLISVIRMFLQDYATRQPFNPFSINGDVNQPSVPTGPPPREDI